jgi:putative transcriptional regulator
LRQVHQLAPLVVLSTSTRVPEASMSTQLRLRCRLAGTIVFALVACTVLGRPAVHAAHRQAPPLNGEQRRGVVRALSVGKILVASPELRDPNFLETVVLLVDFSSKGAVGLILNRQTDVPVSRVFTGPEGLHAGRALMFLGGPVEVQGILGLARGTPGTSDRRVVNDVYLVNSRESLDGLMASGAVPDRCRVYAGYSGWGAEQLQNETISGAWSVLDGTAKIAFDRDPDTLWDRLIKLAGGLQAKTAGEPGLERTSS